MTESGDDKELIFFVIQFMLNILCDVIRDVTDKYVLRLTDLTDRQQFRKRLASVITAKSRHTE